MMRWDLSLNIAVLRRQVPTTISATLHEEAGRGLGEKVIQGQIRAPLHGRGCPLVAPEMHQRTRTLVPHKSEERFQIHSGTFPAEAPVLEAVLQDRADFVQMQQVKLESVLGDELVE